MAGAMRKLGLYLGLVEDDEDEPRDRDDYRDDQRDRYGYEDDYEEPAPAVRRYSPEAPRTSSLHRAEEERPLTRGALAVDPALRAFPVEADPPYRITTMHPRSYNEARQIGEQFRDAIPVIMNLTEMSDADAKRLVDFAAGLIFGLHGSIERVTNKVFLLTPQNVEVTAEDKARIAEGGFFNQS